MVPSPTAGICLPAAWRWSRALFASLPCLWRKRARAQSSIRSIGRLAGGVGRGGGLRFCVVGWLSGSSPPGGFSPAPRLAAASATQRFLAVPREREGEAAERGSGRLELSREVGEVQGAASVIDSGCSPQCPFPSSPPRADRPSLPPPGCKRRSPKSSRKREDGRERAG